MKRSLRWWGLALVVTLASAVWQVLSGPTYPVPIDQEWSGRVVSGKLLRSHSTGSGLPVQLRVRSLAGPGNSPAGADSLAVIGTVFWRRFPSRQEWHPIRLLPAGEDLTAVIPAQPSAGKVEYRVELSRGPDRVSLPGHEAVVARFKNDVPPGILSPHIFFMFCGMLWSTRAGLEALVGGPGRQRQAATTVVLLVIGGLLLGPIVQKYAFGAFWTGWPLGKDLTDNKLAVAVLAWLVAVVRGRSAPPERGRWFVVAAALITLVIFAIPHSLHGSTLDYQTLQTVSG